METTIQGLRFPRWGTSKSLKKIVGRAGGPGCSVAVLQAVPGLCKDLHGSGVGGSTKLS